MTQDIQPSEKTDVRSSATERWLVVIDDFARSIAYSAVQKPVQAVAQIFDKATGSQTAENVHIFNKPADAEFGSLSWHAQQAGGAIGSIAPFIASYALTKRLGNVVNAEQVALDFSKASAAQTASMFRTGEMTTAGFIHGAVFEPNQNKDNMLAERLKHGVVSGASMGAMHVMSNRLSDLTGANLARATIVDRAFTTGIAGAGGGAVGFGVSGLLGDTPLSLNEGIKSVYQGAFTGAILGGAYSDSLKLHQPKSSHPELENFVAKNRSLNMSDDGYFDWQADRLRVRGQERSNDFGFEKLSTLDRVELVAKMQRDADPHLSKPEVIKSFLDTVEPAITADLHTTMEALNRNMERQYLLGDAKKFEEPEYQSNQDARDYAAIRRLERKTEKEREELDDLLAKHQEDVRDRLEIRINDFLYEQNMPPIELKVDPLQSDKEASYSFGRVTIGEKSLRSPDAVPALLNSIYHELTHFRQDIESITEVANRLNLPRNPSAEQINTLTQAVIKDGVTARGAKNSELEELIRQAETSESAEVQRALVENVMELRSMGFDTTYGFNQRFGLSVKDATDQYFKDKSALSEARSEQIEDQIRSVYEVIDDGMVDDFHTILHDIKVDPSKFKTTYGFSAIPWGLKRLADSHAKSGMQLADARAPLTDAQWTYYDNLKPSIVNAFSSHVVKLNKLGDKASTFSANRYFTNAGEREAFATANLAELMKAYEDANR